MVPQERTANWYFDTRGMLQLKTVFQFCSVLSSSFPLFWMANTENVLKERIPKCVRSLSIFLSWLLGGSFSVRFSTSSVFRSNLPLDLTSIHISDWLLLRIRMMLYFWFIIPFSLLLSNWASVELTRPTGRQNIKVFLAIHRKIIDSIWLHSLSVSVFPSWFHSPSFCVFIPCVWL